MLAHSRSGLLKYPITNKTVTTTTPINMLSQFFRNHFQGLHSLHLIGPLWVAGQLITLFSETGVVTSESVCCAASEDTICVDAVVAELWVVSAWASGGVVVWSACWTAGRAWKPEAVAMIEKTSMDVVSGLES